MFVVRLGACPRLSGLGFAALCGCGGCVSWSLFRPGRGAQLWFPATPGWGLLVVLCSPFACPPSSFSLPRRLARCSPGAVPGPVRAVVGVRWGWVGGEASLALARVPFSGVSPTGGRCLHYPSGCNSVVRAVHLYPLGTNGPAPWPGTPAIPHTGVWYTVGRRGVLAGQACLLPAPMDGVPYPQPLAGPEPQYVPWGVILVRPIGHPPRLVPPRAADQRARAYPTFLRVLRWGQYSHPGGPQTPEVGPLACVSCGLPASRPPSLAVLVAVVGFPPFLAEVRQLWWGGGSSPLLTEALVCVSPPLLAAVAAGGGGWSLATPG